jgi:hypothetical protein
MKIEAYLASLFPTLRKDQILDDVRNTRVELRETTLPAYEVATPLLGKWKWKSEEMKSFSTSFSRLVKGGNMISVIGSGLQETIGTLAAAEGYVIKSYNEEVASVALTYKKANVLQFIEAVAFVSKYARKFINYAFVHETALIPDSDTTTKDAITPAEEKWISQNFIPFCTAFASVAQAVKSVEEAIESIPEITIKSSDPHALRETLGEKRLDPFKFGFINAKMNPFYWWGKWSAEGEVARYNAAKEELRLVQLRKLNLEKLNERKPDAALQREIQYTENRAQGLNAQIAKMEAKYA